MVSLSYIIPHVYKVIVTYIILQNPNLDIGSCIYWQVSALLYLRSSFQLEMEWIV